MISWLYAIGQLGAVLVAIWVARKLRGKIAGVQTHWEGAIIPSIAFLAIHLTVWLMWPEYWVPFQESKGFMFLQIMAVLGLYATSLSTKPAKMVGKTLVGIAVLGLLVNAVGVYKIVPPYAESPSAIAEKERALAEAERVRKANEPISFIAPFGTYSSAVFVPRGKKGLIETETGIKIKTNLGEWSDEFGPIPPLDETKTEWIVVQSRNADKLIPFKITWIN